MGWVDDVVDDQYRRLVDGVARTPTRRSTRTPSGIASPGSPQVSFGLESRRVGGLAVDLKLEGEANRLLSAGTGRRVKDLASESPVYDPTMGRKPTAAELLGQGTGLLTTSHLRELGLSRAAAEAVFRALDVVHLPGYSRPMIRVEDYVELIADCTYGNDLSRRSGTSPTSIRDSGNSRPSPLGRRRGHRVLSE